MPSSASSSVATRARRAWGALSGSPSGRRLRRAAAWLSARSLLTPMGAVLLALAALAYWGFGLPRQDHVVSLVALVAMGLVALAVLLVLIGWLRMRALVRARAGAAPALSFSAGSFAEGLVLPRPWLSRWAELDWSWVQPEGFSVRVRLGPQGWVEVVEADRRALLERVRRRFVLEDGLGLARVVFTHESAQAVSVEPRPGALDRSQLLASLAGGDLLSHPAGRPLGDRIEMRRYVPGDPLKLVMWKVYARSQQLMVRTPERALAPDLRLRAYLVSAFGDEAAAAAAVLSIKSGALGQGWVFGADGAEAPLSEPEAAVAQALACRDLRDRPEGQGAGLARFIEETEGDQGKLLLFLPGDPGPWLPAVCAGVRAASGDVSALVVVDAISEPRERRRVERLLRRPPEGADPEGRPTRAALNEVVTALSGAGAEVFALTREGGESLLGGLQSGLRRAG